MSEIPNDKNQKFIDQMLNARERRELQGLKPGVFYDLNAEHAKLLKIIHENPMSPGIILGACVAYLKHGTPEMIRIADAVEYAVNRENALMVEQRKNGIPI
jgi:hypothetical protein